MSEAYEIEGVGWKAEDCQERINMPRDINRNEVQHLVASGAQLVEVLPPDEYNEAHLPGAINIHLKKLDAQTIQPLDPTRPIITYCHDFQ
jgi:rhodanese-related sulfurtransferase